MATFHFILRHKVTGEIREEELKVSRNPFTLYKAYNKLKKIGQEYIIVGYDCDDPEIKKLFTDTLETLQKKLGKS